MWTDYITSISHVLKVNEYGGRQAKGNEKRQCFKGWETLGANITSLNPCFNGRYSQSVLISLFLSCLAVLILVLMEDTLREG